MVKFHKLVLLVAIYLLLAGAISGVYAAMGEFVYYKTLAGEKIINALVPENYPVEYKPSAPGELGGRYFDQVKEYRLVTAEELQLTVGKVAYPGVLANRTLQEGFLTPGETVALEFRVSNLGNVVDDYQLIVDLTGVENPVGWSAEIVRDNQPVDKIEGLQPLLIQGVEPEEVEVVIGVPQLVDFEQDRPRVTLSAVSEQSPEATAPPHGSLTGSDTSGWESMAGIQLLNEQREPVTVFSDREALGILQAYRPGLDQHKLDVRMTASGIDDPLEFQLTRTEHGDGHFYEQKFGFTQGRSRVDWHPAAGKEIPLLAITGEIIILQAEVEFIHQVDTQLYQVLWSPEQAPDHLETVDMVRSWPNPFNPREGQPLVFQNLPADPGMEIYLYNIQGQMVRRLSVGRGVQYRATGNEATWWGKNDSGNRVASGVYLYLINSRYGVTRGQITVVR